MAVLDFPTDRAACPSRTLTPATRLIEVSGRREGLRIVVEIGGTLVVFMLIALGVAALRFGLVLAHSFLH